MGEEGNHYTSDADVLTFCSSRRDSRAATEAAAKPLEWPESAGRCLTEKSPQLQIQNLLRQTQADWPNQRVTN